MTDLGQQMPYYLWTSGYRAHLFPGRYRFRENIGTLGMVVRFAMVWKFVPSLFLALLVFPVLAAPVDSGASWSYGDLDAVLARYVSDAGLVDYDGLLADRAPLDRFVRALAETSPENSPEAFPTRSHRLAYWINAYNALILQRVVDAWPTESVRKIKFLYGIFWREKHDLGGRILPLTTLENKVLRGFEDPRIHFAINCASVGCPALGRTAWKPETLDDDLEQAARRFIGDARHVWFEPDGDVVHLSMIFKWYAKEFTGWLQARGLESSHGVIDFVFLYLPEDQRQEKPGGLKIKWIEYDWSVNATHPDPQQ